MVYGHLWDIGVQVYSNQTSEWRPQNDCTVGARRRGLSVWETADLLGFSHTTVSRVIVWKTKNMQCCSFVGESVLLMRGVRGEWADCLSWQRCSGKWNNHTLLLCHAEDHLWTCEVSNLEMNGSQKQTYTPGFSRSAKSRKLKPRQN